MYGSLSRSFAGIATAMMLGTALVASAPGCSDSAPTDDSHGESTIAEGEALHAILSTAQAAVVEGEPAKAEAVLRESVKTYPGDHDLRMALADLLTAQGKVEPAHRQYEEAIAIDPRSAVALFHSGVTARLLGDHARGLERLAAAAEAEPSNPEYALQAGLAELDAGELDAAEVSLLRAATLNDADATAWGSLAEVALRRGEATIAAEHARRASLLEPRAVAWRVLLARALKRTGDAEAAFRELESLDAEARTSPGVLATAGECLGLLGRPADAAAWYAEAAEQAPGDDQLAYDTAIWFERAGDTEKAIEYATKGAAFAHEGCEALLKRLNADR